MKRAPIWATLLTLAGALAAAALTLYAYRELLARPFAADDYQWLLNVRGLGLPELLRTAFDPSAQTHFYRPLVWLLFWAQLRLFGLDPRGYHVVSLGLHLLNAGLLAGFAYRLLRQAGRRAQGDRLAAALVAERLAALSAFAFVALHPAPFEAVAWVSAQSELLAAALLLLALLLWQARPPAARGWLALLGGWPALAAALALGLALLAKESAAIGLALLVLLGQPAPGGGARRSAAASAARASIFNVFMHGLTRYLLPVLITLAYLALQIGITRRNYLLAQGSYGLGPQLLLNPLRSLALLVAPLPGSEHADAAWLVPAGALVALLLLGLLLRGPAGARRLVLALGVTLLPTAPFVSPPDSRYLYLPVLVGGLLLALGLARALGFLAAQLGQPGRPALQRLLTGILLLVLALSGGTWLWRSAGELHEREWRFAAGAGPGGSLWRVASEICAAPPPERVVLVEPPIAPPHAQAIVELACGRATRTLIVVRDQVDGAVKRRTVVLGFPGGTATLERST